MRYAARRDNNDNSELRQAAERMGWWLIKTHTPGDYLGAHRGVWYVVEIKDPKKKGWESEFTEDQKEFHAEAFERGLPVLVWYGVEDIQRDSSRKVA